MEDAIEDRDILLFIVSLCIYVDFFKVNDEVQAIALDHVPRFVKDPKVDWKPLNKFNSSL